MKMGLFGDYADINISIITIFEWDNVISKDRTGQRAQNLVLRSGLSGVKDILVYVRKISEFCGNGQVFKSN